MSEYSANSGGAPCSYGSLGNYNDGYSMAVPPVGKVVSGQYIVPQWSAIGYDSLTQKAPSCSGYPNITDAYGKGADACQTTYRTSLCGSK